MATTTTDSCGDESLCPIAVLIDELRNEDVQMDFWKHRILFSILESIVNSTTSMFGLSTEVITYLGTILMEARLRKMNSNVDNEDLNNIHMMENDNDEKLCHKVNDSSKPFELSPKIKSLLSTYISMEIKSIEQSIVKVYLEKLNGVYPIEHEGNKLKITERNKNLLEKIVQISIRRNEKQNIDEFEIQRLIKIRDEEIIEYNLELEQLKELMTNFADPCLLNERHHVDAEYYKHLKNEGENLDTQMEIKKMSQLIDENPPELISEFDENYKELVDICMDLEKEISDINKLETSFNSLSPEFQKLMRDREELEEDIKTKEWALKSLEEYEDSSNTSFGDAVATPARNLKSAS